MSITQLPNQVKNNDLEFFQAVKQMIGDNYDEVEVGPPHFRPGTKLPIVKYNFVFSGAGMGDWICYMPAMVWIAKNLPWIKGRIFAAEFFCEFAKNVMRDFHDWKINPTEKINELAEPRTVFRGPGISINGKSAGGQLLNGTGAHLVDVGFAYFVNKSPPPEGADVFPELDFEFGNWRNVSPNETKIQNIPPLTTNTYAVFTTGGVTPVRTVPGEYWNPIIDHVISIGLTPVFIGKSNIAGCVNVTFPDGCNYDKGIDLRNKTTMMEAAYLMDRAACVLGLDNGLIHLAACTNAKIIAAYNIVDPKERRPNRRPGPSWIELSLSKEELACANCQSEMRSLPAHTFKHCLYGDKKCIDLLFDNNGRRWTDAIDRILSPPGDHPF